MRMRGALLPSSTFAVSLLVSACGPAVTAGTPAGATRSWEVGFELSGGIAGMMKQMTISHDGRLVAENLKRRTRVEKRMSADQLRELHRLVEQAQSVQGTAMGSPGRCADCMQYRLTIREPESRASVSESGAIEQRQSRSPELLKFLIAVMNETI